MREIIDCNILDFNHLKELKTEDIFSFIFYILDSFSNFGVGTLLNFSFCEHNSQHCCSIIIELT